MNRDKCIACDGKGWVQVIDPPLYQRFDAGNTTQMPLHLTSAPVARAVICPVCKGTGGRVDKA